ncbi:MAG: hypothetical protein Q8O51_02465 [bacterium]|nr:hypothetical protein [bacterium]
MAKAKSPDAGSTRRVPIRRVKAKEDNADEIVEKPAVEETETNEEDVAVVAPEVDASDDAPEEKPRTRKAQRTLRDDVLSEIYNDPAETPKDGDVSRIQRTAKRSKKLLVTFIVIGVLAAAAIAGYIIFGRGGKFSEQVALTAQAPVEVASGDDVAITVTVKNQERIDLRNAELTYTAPEGFTFRTSTPAASNEFNNAWSLGTIKESGGTTVTISGRLIGEQAQAKKFSFMVTYTPSNFNTEFQMTAEVTVTINKSVLTLTPEVPVRLPPGRPVAIPVILENVGTDSLEQVKLVVEYPEGFTFTKADPKPAADDTVWEFATLGAGKKIKVVITGVLTGNVGDTPEFKFRAGRESATGFQVQAESSGIGTIVKAGLTLTTTVTNPGAGTTIGWGETLNYVFTYKNDSESEMKDVSLTVEFNQKNADGQDVVILDLDNRSDIQNGKLSGRTMTWTKKEIPALAVVAGGATKDILLRVPVKSGPTIAAQGDRNFVITTAARISVGSIADVNEKNVETQAAPLTTKVTTKLNVEPEGRYYTDEQIPVGTGPLPPQVGQVTTYRLGWTLTNPTNEVSQVVATATLPSNVTWLGKQAVTAGSAVAFDPVTREVSWRINRVPPGTGSLFASLEATFDVSVTPVATEVGQLLILLNQTVVTARDAFTEQDLRVEKAIVTSDLPGDVAAQGKGLVVAAPAV